MTVWSETSTVPALLEDKQLRYLPREVIGDGPLVSMFRTSMLGLVNAHGQFRVCPLAVSFWRRAARQ